MKSLLRPTTVDDLGRVRELLRGAFKARDDAPFLNPSLMAWKYWDQRADWEGPRAYVMERNGVMTAHGAIYPMTLGGLRGAQVIDWAASEESPGAGVTLMEKLQARFDFVYSIGGSETTCRILPTLGFVERAQQWRGARPLRPFRQILKHQHRNWKLGPRLIRNVSWAYPRNPGLPEGWTAEEIERDEFSASLRPPAAASDYFSARPPAFFEYLVRCPVMRVRVYGIRSAGEPRGHFAICVLREQARVVGVWLYETDAAVWGAAFALARQAAAQIGEASEIVAAGSPGSGEQAAVGSGFRIIRHVPVYLLDRGHKLALPPDFQFQLCDDDTFWWDSGRCSFWT